MTPIRPDLATVAPLFYPIVEQQRFESMAAACSFLGLTDPRAQIARATIEGSSFLVLEQFALGDPKDDVRAVLVSEKDGTVKLCCGLFGQLTPDPDEAMAVGEQLANALPNGDRLFVAVAEFRVNPRSAPH
jgi:hypothetical protein